MSVESLFGRCRIGLWEVLELAMNRIGVEGEIETIHHDGLDGRGDEVRPVHHAVRIVRGLLSGRAQAAA